MTNQSIKAYFYNGFNEYDIYINPTKQDLIEANKAWFEPDGL